MGGISGVDTTIELRRLGCTAIIIGLTGRDLGMFVWFGKMPISL